MARLRDTAPGAAPLSLDAATEYICAHLQAVADVETVAVADADGRIAATDVRAAIPLPPFDNSAVDGWAVDSADLARQGDTRLPARGRIAAGASPADIAADHAAVRVFTGARIPHDADTVFMQEDVEQQGDVVVLPSGLARGANLRAVGEDVAAGEIVVPAGRVLQPQDLALLHAVGETHVSVRRRLRVALLSTGDELREPGEPLPTGAVYDANRAMLRAMLRRAGVAVDDLGIVRDEPDELRRRLAEAAAGHDLILTSGGVSTGEADHVKAVVEGVGAMAIRRIAIRPGKPVGIGRIGEAVFVGLPGNPVAAFITFAWVVRPALSRLGGSCVAPPLGLPVRLGFEHRKRAGVREFVRARLARSADGAAIAHKFSKGGTGILTSLTLSDGLVELPEAWTTVEAGSFAQFYPYCALL